MGKEMKTRGLLPLSLLALGLFCGFADARPPEVVDSCVVVQPIVLRDDQGVGPAQCRIKEALIDQVYSTAGIDFLFLDPLYFDNRDARDGKIDVDIIVDDATRNGVLRGEGSMINIFFVNAINGRPAPCGLGQQPGSIAFIAMDAEAPAAQDAFVIAHEAAHNLGLAHAVDDPKVADDISNLMGDGPFEERIAPSGLVASQVETIRRSPLVKGRFECLDEDGAREAIVDESIEPFFSLLQRREIAAFTRRAVEFDSLDECRDEARRRFADAVLAFSEEEAEAIIWFAQNISRLLCDDYPLFARHPWRFIKVADHLCGGFSHTRGDCIVFSNRTVKRIVEARETESGPLALQGPGLLFVHEQMHNLQRLRPELFARLYRELWHFERAQVEPNAWITERQVTNPDGVRTEWIAPYKNEAGDACFLWMKTLFAGDDPLPVMGRDFMSLAFRLQKKGERLFAVVTDEKGRPLGEPIGAFGDYVNRFSTNRGLDHPNEIAAYMFVEMLAYDLLLPESERPQNYEKAIEPRLDPFREWCRRNLR